MWQRLQLSLGVAVALFAAAFATPARADDEVVVSGAPSTSEPGAVTLSKDEVRRMPGAFGDAFRAVDALPGALPFQLGAPYVILRGAPPGSSVTLIDGIPVPLLFHLGFGPAVVPPGLLSGVELFAGGAPADFGRAAGGFISATTKEPEARPHLEAEARLFDAGALVETPLANGHADALVAGRYSYLGPLLSVTSPGTDLAYWDYQARAGIDVGDHDRVSIFAFGSRDHRGELAGFGDTTFSSEFHRVDVRYDRSWGDDGRLRLAVTLGDDRSANEQAAVHSQLARVRLELSRRLAETILLRAGADASFTHTAAATSGSPDLFAAPVVAAIYPAHDDVVAGVHADVVWKVSRAFTVVPGARVDSYGWRVPHPPPPAVAQSLPTATAVAVEPRLSARLAVARDVTLVSTIGLHEQPPSFFVPVPGLQPVTFSRGLQRTLQRSAGVEVAAPSSIALSGTGFWHENQNVTTFSTCEIPAGGFDLTSTCVAQRTRGRAYGLELFIHRPLTRRLGGLVSYTLSRTEEDATAPLRGSRPTAFDHTHVLNLVATYDLGRRWNAGARFAFYSGRPGNGGRLDSTPRLDLRLEKRWSFFGAGWIAVVLEGLNVTFSREEEISDYGVVSHGSPIVIPSIGVELSY